MIRVLLVDDSNSVRAVLRRFFARTPDLVVVAEAVNGEDAVRAVHEHQPHAVVMDLQMPGMDGYVAIERIMAERPTPILVLSSRATRNQMQTAFEAMRRGAIEVLPKPEDTPSWEVLAESLPRILRLVAGVRAVPAAAKKPPRARPAKAEAPVVKAAGALRWVAIGASTGGPAAIRAFFEEVPADLPVTFLIVQHIAAGFEVGFAEWLNKELPFDVRLARDGEAPATGTVRIAPAGSHLRLAPGGELHLDRDTPPRRGGHRPSVDDLFSSCAEVAPAETAGVLLTGMGADGVEGLLALRQAGGLTLVQDEASSIVFGMPRVALERGATEIALPPRDLARVLVPLVVKGERGKRP